MTDALRRRLARLEGTLTPAAAPFATDIPTLAPEEIKAALAVVAPFADGEAGVHVVALDSFIPPEAAGDVEQALTLLQAAYRLGCARLGFQSDPARYIAAALVEMLPEPRSPEASQMAKLLHSGALPVIRYHVVPAVDGRPVPDGWRPSG